MFTDKKEQAHNIRGKLAIILLYVELLESKEAVDLEKREEMLQKIKEATQEIVVLMDDVTNKLE